MLQLVRDKAKGVVSWIILSLVFVVFASWGFKGFNTKKNDRVIASIDGKKIYNSEISKVLDSIIASYGSENAELLNAKKDEIKDKVLEDVIYRELIIKRLQKLNYRVSDETIVNAIRNTDELKIDGKFSPDKYKNMLKQMKLTEAEYLRFVSSWMLIQQFSAGLEDSSFTNEQDVKDSLRRDNQRRDFGFFKINNADIAAKIEISDQEIQSHYNKYQDQYVADDKYIIEYITLNIGELLNEIKISDTNIEQYYVDNLQEFVEPERLQIAHILVKMEKNSDADISGEVKAKAEDLLARLKLGEKFDEVAKKYSQDKTTASAGGSLGWFTKNDPLPEEIFNLNKKGDFTSLVQTDFGYHIFYLQDKKQSKQLPFDEVKTMLKARMKQEQAETQLLSLSEDLKNMMFQMQSFEKIVCDLKLKLKTTPGFATLNEQTDLLALPAVQKVLHDLKGLPLASASELVQISDDKFVAIKIKEIKPGVKYSLDQVRNKVIAELKKLKASSEINKITNDAVEQIKAGANPRQVAEKLGSKWQMVKSVTRNQQSFKDPNVTTDLIQIAFDLPSPAIIKARSVKSVANKDGTQTIVALSEVYNSDLNETSNEQLDKVAHKIASSKGVLDFMTAMFTVRDQSVVEKYA
jgi:peptidyl-prolyl cis-trans isomerase D